MWALVKNSEDITVAGNQGVRKNYDAIFTGAGGDLTIVEIDNYKVVTSTDISFTANNTITTAGAVDFSKLGLSAGSTIIITTGSSTNDGTYTVATVSATVITTSETTISTESAATAGRVDVDASVAVTYAATNASEFIPLSVARVDSAPADSRGLFLNRK